MFDNPFLRQRAGARRTDRLTIGAATKLPLLIAATLLLAPAAAWSADLSGAWKFEGTNAQGAAANALTCTLTQSGSDIRGSCVTAQGSAQDVTGTVTGNEVDFGYDAAGSPLHIDFKGEIQPDGTVKGTVSASTPPKPFVGTRQ